MLDKMPDTRSLRAIMNTTGLAKWPGCSLHFVWCLQLNTVKHIQPMNLTTEAEANGSHGKAAANKGVCSAWWKTASKQDKTLFMPQECQVSASVLFKF